MLLGRAFQIQDDILDAEGTADTVGKKIRKDAVLGK
jgi:farnesyl diphosphate synthase